MTFFGINSGTFVFFLFSFLAGLYITTRIFSVKETLFYRLACAISGIAYMVVTALAFVQLEGVKGHFGWVEPVAEDVAEEKSSSSL